jgi:3-hydroxymyristoyl/3-hydroxydecanoyl-(acyl carrier protein) dehydratase
MHYQFIDRVLEVEAPGAGWIVLVKTFPRTEDYFNGTFRRPEEVPACLVLETMAAAGSLLLAMRSGYQANAALLKVNRATFSRPVHAGAELKVRLELTASQGDWTGLEDPRHAAGMAQALARSFVGETQVAEADMLFLCVPMAWVLGSGGGKVLTHYLELMGIADARP